MTSISTPEPSLSSRAMLCSLSISVWSARKHDPEASEEIAQRHGAQPDAGRYHKVLLPKAALAEVQKIVSEARQDHYFMTLPWDDNGYRVLPAAAYMDHTERMRQLSNQFTPAIDTLTQQFGQLVEEAKVRLGGLFRSDDYPTPEELGSKFSFETKVMPLPNAGDFRVTLGDGEKERIKRQITTAVEASLQVASLELWQRLYEAVSHLAERLRAYKMREEGVEHPFWDSLVTNLVKLVDVFAQAECHWGSRTRTLGWRGSSFVTSRSTGIAQVGVRSQRDGEGCLSNRHSHVCLYVWLFASCICQQQRWEGSVKPSHLTTAQS